MPVIQNKNARFGGKVADVMTDSFTVIITTAKEGFFEKLSTMIFDLSDGTPRPCVKIIYSKSLRKSDRSQFHDLITEAMNAGGEDGQGLSCAVKTVIESLRERGVIKEAIDLT